MTEIHRVCLGAIAGAHGVSGEFKVKYFTAAPANIAAYGPVETEDRSRKLTLKFIRAAKGDFAVVYAKEVKTREEALSLKGTRLYVDRKSLPEPDDDEFYLDDLVGLNVFTKSGEPSGVVNAVYNFGAGDILELKNAPGVKGLQLVPFTRKNVPNIDIGVGKITIADTLFDDDEDDKE